MNTSLPPVHEDMIFNYASVHSTNLDIKDMRERYDEAGLKFLQYFSLSLRAGYSFHEVCSLLLWHCFEQSWSSPGQPVWMCCRNWPGFLLQTQGHCTICSCTAHTTQTHNNTTDMHSKITDIPCCTTTQRFATDCLKTECGFENKKNNEDPRPIDTRNDPAYPGYFRNVVIGSSDGTSRPITTLYSPAIKALALDHDYSQSKHCASVCFKSILEYSAK